MTREKPAETQKVRRVYREPKLTRFGDLRGLTLGGSPGAGDSGGGSMDPQALGQGPPPYYGWG